MSTRMVLGKRINRLDGIPKSSGKAKYPSDVNRPGMLFGSILTCPHAHAKVKSIDTTEAAKLPGVAGIRVTSPAGAEIQWAGAEVAWIAADTEQHAIDAMRAIRVEYEVLPHFVKEERRAEAGPRARPAGEQLTGDPDDDYSKAEAKIAGYYAIPVLTHCCLEPHGAVVEWKGDKIEYWPSSQGVSVVGGDLAQQLGIPASQIHVSMDYMGGGFGSKFPSDLWGREAAQLSKGSGGRAVKMFLDRASELTIAGVRPSAYANIKVAGKKDGTITSWQSESWATGGFTGGGMPPIPYIFTNIPNKKLNHTAVSVNAGGARAWRAPNHQQACFLTFSAIEDFAAEIGMDPAEVLIKNLGYTARAPLYERQIRKAQEMANWKQLWHKRGDSGRGPVKRGLGIALSTWGGGGNLAECRIKIHPDGSVELEQGTQDLGVGTRTVVTMVAAETFGLKVTDITTKIGDNAYPFGSPSGGSTTVGGVTSSTRKAAVNALDELFQKVAPALDAPADQLEAVGGKIQVKGNPAKSITWKQACAKIGTSPIVGNGRHDPKNPMGLASQGVGGVQIADVSVDIETGVVKMNKMVAVQDCGLVVNEKTAESQVFGGIIMNICGALMEERVMDQMTGRFLNADMEFYKLAGIKDIGEIEVHMDVHPDNDKRGVIGLGEPCAISTIAAIGNAVANAIGVRVPRVPLSPDHVLTALYGEKMDQNRSRA
ncbi:MAG: xanthine dehydrogenase family protein molybdopterin-binding subunit [Bryobacter sp.]|nr:xanthine dehydrogenase family protein molybdopterin-binding subunit [Bryobacter sp.]